MTEKQNQCCECGNRTVNRSMICDTCAPAYATPGCGECIPCKSDMVGLVPCLSEPAKLGEKLDG